MNLDLTDEETAALLRELDGLIDGDRYFMSPRIKSRCCVTRHNVLKPCAPGGGNHAERKR
jgi:hypothetical protein